jgi:hypothetical protein
LTVTFLQCHLSRARSPSARSTAQQGEGAAVRRSSQAQPGPQGGEARTLLFSLASAVSLSPCRCPLSEGKQEIETSRLSPPAPPVLPDWPPEPAEVRIRADAHRRKPGAKGQDAGDSGPPHPVHPRKMFLMRYSDMAVPRTAALGFGFGEGCVMRLEGWRYWVLFVVWVWAAVAACIAAWPVVRLWW